MYQLVSDEDQILQASQLFCHDSPDQKDAVKVLFLNAREKYFSEEERSKSVRFSKSSIVLSLQTFPCNRADSYLVQAIRKMEIRLGLYQENGIAIPNEALVLYFSLHSKSSTAAFLNVAQKAIHVTTNTFLAGNNDGNIDMYHLEQVLKSTIHAASPCKSMCKENKYLDLDIDTKDERWLKSFVREVFPFIQDSIKCIVETNGGFHIILVSSILGKNHVPLLKYLGRPEHSFTQTNRVGEMTKQTLICLNSSAQIPCPGTWQGSFRVKFRDLNEFIYSFSDCLS